MTSLSKADQPRNYAFHRSPAQKASNSTPKSTGGIGSCPTSFCPLHLIYGPRGLMRRICIKTQEVWAQVIASAEFRRHRLSPELVAFDPGGVVQHLDMT